MLGSSRRVHLIYDGDCPFCQNYVAFVQVTRAVPGLRLLSARDGGDEVEEARRRGIDLDREMVLVIDDEWFTGEAAMSELARRAKRFTTINGLWHSLLKRPQIGRFIYTRLVYGRLLVLRILKRKRIFDSDNE